MIGFRTRRSIDDIESIVVCACSAFSESAPRNEYKASGTNQDAISKTRIESHEILNYGNNGSLNTIDRSQPSGNIVECVFQSFVHPADAGNNASDQ